MNKVSEFTSGNVLGSSVTLAKEDNLRESEGREKDKTGTKGGISLPSLSLRFSSLDSLFPLPLPFLPLPPFDGSAEPFGSA